MLASELVSRSAASTFKYSVSILFQAFVAMGDYNGHVGLGVKCSKEVATAIRGAIILAKLSIIPVRLGYWGNKIGSPHTVPCKVSQPLLSLLDYQLLNLRLLASVVLYWSDLYQLLVVPVLSVLLSLKSFYKWLALLTVTLLQEELLLHWETLVRKQLCSFL